jgi:hypothetical protein
MSHAQNEASATWRQSLKRRLILWLMRAGPHKLIDGIWVGSLSSGSDALLRIENALKLIKTYDPLRHDRLSHDLDLIVVRVLTGEIGRFDHPLRACCLDTRFVLAETSSPEMIAATIVHEATHARLWRRGIRYEQEFRHRVEAVCYRRELAFAAKLPNSYLVREQAQRSLSAYAKPETWSDAAVESRVVEGGTEAMRHLGFPSWLIKFILWFRRGPGIKIFGL